MHSIDKAALYEDSRYDRSAQHSLGSLGSLGSAVTVSREAFELLRLKDRAMDNTKEGITIADCRQVHCLPLLEMLLCPCLALQKRHSKQFATYLIAPGLLAMLALHTRQPSV